MFRRTVAALVLLLALSADALAADAPKDAQKVPRACASARNRTLQQERAVADIDVRIDKAKSARSTCASTKACRKADRGIEALGKRKQDYETQVQRSRDAEARACTGR